MLLNWYFTPPVHRITIADPKNILALAVFVAVAVSVASVVGLAARRTHQAARLRAESEILSFLAGNVLRGETGLEARLERVRETFGTESVALLEGESDVAPWTCAGRVGLERELERPEDADVDVPIGDHVALALTGRVGGDRGLFCRGGRQGDFHTCLWAAVDGHGPARWPAGTTWLYICWGFAVVLLGALLKVVNDYREAALAQVQLREVGSQLR